MSRLLLPWAFSLRTSAKLPPPPEHQNLRGPGYWAGEDDEDDSYDEEEKEA